MKDEYDEIRWREAVPQTPESFERRVRETCRSLEEQSAPPVRFALRLAAAACVLALVLMGGLLLGRGGPAPDSLAPAPGEEPVSELWVETPGGFIDTVYWSAEAEPYYHRSGQCQELGGAPAGAVSVAAALEKGLEPCARCVGDGDVFGDPTPEEEAALREETYWVIAGGQAFHRDAACSRMRGYAYGSDGAMEGQRRGQISLLGALSEGLAPCPDCLEGFRLSLDALLAHADEIRVYTSARDAWFHPAPDRVEETDWFDLIRCTAREALAMGKAPCPCSYLYPVDAADAVVPDGQIIAWSDADEPWYHRMNMCQGNRFSTSDTVARWRQAQKRACPVCMDRERPARDAGSLSESVAAQVIFFAAQDAFYHKDYHCGHAVSSGEMYTHTLGVAYGAGKEPCPYCAQ